MLCKVGYCSVNVRIPPNIVVSCLSPESIAAVSVASELFRCILTAFESAADRAAIV